MRKTTCLLAAILTVPCCIVCLEWSRAWAATPRLAVENDLPRGYRDWRLVSVAHEAGKTNDIRAILGNDIAIKAYRERALPFPDGAIIARLAWNYTASEENNKVFGSRQSFVAGTPTNVQFMIKDSRRYSATGGWGFLQFNDGKPVEAARLEGCFGCHVPVQARDFVFTKYSP